MMTIGETVMTYDGKMVRITSGSFLGGYGRVSNFWHWVELNQDGSDGNHGSGYGWDPVDRPAKYRTGFNVMTSKWHVQERQEDGTWRDNPGFKSHDAAHIYGLSICGKGDYGYDLN